MQDLTLQNSWCLGHSHQEGLSRYREGCWKHCWSIQCQCQCQCQCRAGLIISSTVCPPCIGIVDCVAYGWIWYLNVHDGCWHRWQLANRQESSSRKVLHGFWDSRVGFVRYILTPTDRITAILNNWAIRGKFAVLHPSGRYDSLGR